MALQSSRVSLNPLSKGYTGDTPGIECQNNYPQPPPLLTPPSSTRLNYCTLTLTVSLTTTNEMLARFLTNGRSPPC